MTLSIYFYEFFFFVINIFYLFFHTQQHNIHSKQTKQNNRHILHVLKVQTKGRERGWEKTTTKQVLPPYNHIFYGVNILTQVRLTAEFKPAIFGNKIFRVYIKYSQSQNCIQQMKRSNITPIL